VAENVQGLLSSEDGRFFGGVLRDLARLGFDVGWGCYTAECIGAPHERERVFTVGHAASLRREDLAQLLHIFAESKVYLGAWNGRRVDKPGIIGVANGISEQLDRLHCLGNAVVPQQAYPIFKAIADIELQRNTREPSYG
jgi:DNA (cytosine-5)-methyltransferase 1